MQSIVLMSSTFLNEGVLRSLFFLHLLLLLLYRFARNEFSVYQYTKMCRYIRLLEMRDLDQIKRYNLMSIYTPYFAIFLFIKKGIIKNTFQCILYILLKDTHMNACILIWTMNIILSSNDNLNKWSWFI